MNPGQLREFVEACRLAPDDMAQSRALDHASHQTLKTPGAAGELIDLLGTNDGETALLVLQVSLDMARMAQENRRPEGGRFLADTEAELAARAAAGSLGTRERFAIGSAYVQAGLPPSEHLMMDMDTLSDFDERRTEMPDPDALLDSLHEEVGGEPMALYMALSEMMATLPKPLRAMMAGQIAQRPEDTFARVGAYWLLDADPAKRLAAAEGFGQRLAAGGMDAATITRLVGMRSWLPADAARDAVDRLIRDAMRHDIVGGAAPRSWKHHRILASIPDGAGAQSLAVVARAGGRRGIAMLLLKQGYGVRDAYLIPCSGASEQKRFVARIGAEVALHDVTEDFFRSALATALGEGGEAGQPPAPGLIDLVEPCGLQDLRPEPRSLRDMLDIIDPEGEIAGMAPQRLGRLVGRSADWPGRFAMLDSWFEASGEMQEMLAAAPTPAAQERAVWRHLEGRRGWWARMFMRTAETLHAAQEPSWREFAATAHALDTGRAVKNTPIMGFIADRSLEAHDAQAGPPAWDWASEPALEPVDVPDSVAPEKKNELARLLKGSDISPDWLDGNLMAVVVAPKWIDPTKWIAPLLAAPAGLPDRESLRRFIDIVMLRYTKTNDEASDPKALKARIDRLSALADWAAGFAAVTTGFKSAWKARTLKKDDKAMLRRIGEAADSEEHAASISALLPAWLARRHEVRA